MNGKLGIDHTGEWTPKQHVIDSGWDFCRVDETARLGVSATDAEGLTKRQQDTLRKWCREFYQYDP